MRYLAGRTGLVLSFYIQICKAFAVKTMQKLFGNFVSKNKTYVAAPVASIYDVSKRNLFIKCKQ